jgi:hypothetical protein
MLKRAATNVHSQDNVDGPFEHAGVTGATSMFKPASIPIDKTMIFRSGLEHGTNSLPPAG